ncbi:hypothetical protein [Goodfellowiella coeruleoviolacea]|uniref:hypothetical protein n=1 Tax=Goodfellowiella coeruleoviolacea TaxID=334858 RepID=UPI0020A3039E|nr:hypothetical protein [Goodfellowiella coeruleoviolacea]
MEPIVGLEWSRALEPSGDIGLATCPADTRRAWIHQAHEDQVRALYRAVLRVDARARAPWWVRALDSGRLASRAAGFAVEDQVNGLLAIRPGWVYVPGTGYGEDGYWEFVPSESGLTGPMAPTTVQLTDAHDGWVEIVPAHLGEIAPTPRWLDGVAELGARLDEVEAVDQPD